MLKNILLAPFQTLTLLTLQFLNVVSTSLDCTMLRELLSKQGNLPVLWAVQRWFCLLLMCSDCFQQNWMSVSALYMYQCVYIYIHIYITSTHHPSFVLLFFLSPVLRSLSDSAAWIIVGVSCLLEKLWITNGNICSLDSNPTPRRPTLTSKMKSVTSLLFISSSCV